MENIMVLPEEGDLYTPIPDEVWSDMESNAYDDAVFDELTRA